MTYQEILEALNVDTGATHPSLKGAVLVKTNDVFRFGIHNLVGIPYDEDYNELTGEQTFLVKVSNVMLAVQEGLEAIQGNPTTNIECTFEYEIQEDALTDDSWTLVVLSNLIKNN